MSGTAGSRAHIGLYPDMIEEMVSSELIEPDEFVALFRSAESFAKTWEACQARSHGIPP